MKLVSHPVLCNYYVTYRCNAKCDFCDIWERPSPYVSLQNVKENLLDLKKLGVSVIDFTGGEPLLHQQLPEFLQIAKELGFITTVTTNGLLYPKLAKKLKGLIDMLHFSLDSHLEEEHNRLRGVNCFSHVMESIKVAKDLGEKPDILFTVFPENLEAMQQVYQQICLPNDLVMILNPAFEYNSINAHGIFNTQDLQFLRSFGKKKKVYLNEAFIDLRLNGGNSFRDPICKAASTTLVISPENKLVLPCYHLGKDEMDINGHLFNLYKSERVQQLIKLEGRLPECEGCTINCYMQPSFATHLSKYWLKALPSTIKYNFMKGTWKQMLKI